MKVSRKDYHALYLARTFPSWDYLVACRIHAGGLRISRSRYEKAKAELAQEMKKTCTRQAFCA